MSQKWFRWLFGSLVCLLVLGLPNPSSDAETAQTKLTSSGPVNVVENPHGSYTNNTNQCAQCHSPHRGKTEKLLVASSNRDMCFLCHDGRGSKYDVKNGKTYDPVSGTITDSAAGGFNPLAGFTSNHLIEETNAAAGGSGQTTLLLCTSCHNPHGSPNHRFLLTNINGKSGIAVSAAITRSPFTNREVISYKSGTKDANGVPVSGMSQFCSACHNDYVYKNNEPGSYDKTKYRHPDGIELNGKYSTLPLEGVPSGAYPNPKTAATTGGSLTGGDYYYIITASNQEGESAKGYEKKITVPASGKVRLVWDAVTNGTKYSAYRAGPLTSPPADETSYNLVADSDTQKSRFFFTDSPSGGAFAFEDTGGLQSSSVHPPNPANIPNPGKVFCLTCHYAHGSKTVDVTTGQSKLKRLDNLGVCENCHKK